MDPQAADPVLPATQRAHEHFGLSALLDLALAELLVHFDYILKEVLSEKVLPAVYLFPELLELAEVPELGLAVLEVLGQRLLKEGPQAHIALGQGPGVVDLEGQPVVVLGLGGSPVLHFPQVELHFIGLAERRQGFPVLRGLQALLLGEELLAVGGVDGYAAGPVLPAADQAQDAPGPGRELERSRLAQLLPQVHLSVDELAVLAVLGHLLEEEPAAAVIALGHPVLPVVLSGPLVETLHLGLSPPAFGQKRKVLR